MRLVLLLVLLAVPTAASPRPAGRPAASRAPPLTRLGQSEQTRANAPGYFFHHLPGEATIQVQVEGAVVHPGLYEVSATTDLRRLLALAGGPEVGVREDRRDRRVELRLVRPLVGVVYGATLEEAAEDPTVIPPLHHDDALLVEVVERRRFGWQDALAIAGAAGSLALLIDALAGR